MDDRFMGWGDSEWGTLLRTAPTPRSQRPASERAVRPGSGLVRDRSWMTQAACRGTDPILFYPMPSSSQEDAKATCAGCPVRAECLDYALATREPFGIWGGMNERERKRHRKQVAA